MDLFNWTFKYPFHQLIHILIELKTFKASYSEKWIDESHLIIMLFVNIYNISM